MSQIIRDVMEIARCAVQYRAESLAPLGLKSCHSSYLIEICAEPGISQDKLAQRICINKSNVARQAAVLEEGGFIIRIPSAEDKRVLGLYPTEKTLALIDRIAAVNAALEDCVTGSLTPEEKQTLSNLQGKMKIRASDWMENH